MRAVLEPNDLQRYDELSGEQGMRAHWRPLIDRLRADESPDAVRRSLELTRRLIVENGVTYNVYADPQGADRPWALDSLPFVLPAAEWQAIEAGVAQRAHLLNELLADIYGPQRLLAEGHIPAELPFGHPNYLWPCQGLKPVGGAWLHTYAADLARAPDGRWWLLADRTQAPSGAGYALENREILEQVHPEAIADMGVRRVRGFFGHLRELLVHSGPAGDEAPLAVILTPGPYNETYFEHAFLARQLGMPLVEGHDLTVRGDTVYLKTLGGLRRVHAILRRLDDDFCDPLELRGDSALGIPGLLGALRAGRVMVSNALGTGVIESAAWLGFLPPVAERLIGEKLLLPEVATWWLGEKPALDYVLANLDRLVIKPAYPNQRFEPMFGREFAGRAREMLVERLRNRPYAYVAQEHVRLSHAPVWKSAVSAELAARALTFRVYAVRTPNGYRVMPGGLARVANEEAADVVSTQRGGGAKDVWVLSDEGAAQDDYSTTQTSARPSQQRQDYIPSRLVENLYWLGRYAVRAENTARLMLRTLGSRSDSRVWQHARQICRDLGAVGEDQEVYEALRTRDAAGLQSDVKHLAWCASQVRNRLSARYWRGVVGLQRQMQEAVATRGSSREVYERVLLSLAALTGFSEEDMMHDEGWRLMRLGRRIERLQFVAGILVRQITGPHATRAETVEWLLDVCDSTPIYRARYLGTARLSQMLNLLLYDDGHPMALVFLRRSIDRDLEELARSLGGERERGAPDVPLLPQGSAELLDATGQAGDEARAELAASLRQLLAEAGDLSDRISRRYFALIESDAQGAGHMSKASRRYRIRHETRYEYAADVVHSHHLLHLVPRPAPFQECLEHEITVSPENHRRVNEIDAFGNPMIRIELAQPHRELRVVSEMQIEVHPRPAVLVDSTDSWEKVRDSFAYHGAWPARDQLDAARFRHESPHVRVKHAFTAWSAVCFPSGQALLQCAEALSTKLHKDLEYVPGATSISTSATEILEKRRGVCQDFAHLMIACLRSRGLPARYVSGYLRTNARAGEDGEKLVGADASHAWVSVWSPPFGWVDFDPTNGCFAGTDHVAVAWGRDFGDVSPLRGVILGGAQHQLSVAVEVAAIESMAARNLDTSASST